MGYTILQKLPSAAELMQAMPLSAAHRAKILQDRREVNAILAGADARLLIIVGPCSAWPSAAVLEYAERLANLERRLPSRLKIIMRVYTHKSRTITGWNGPLQQPDPFSPPDIATGLHDMRALMLQIIALGLPIADEALFTHSSTHFLDLLTWVAIGARSSEDPEHRIFASAVDCAVGLKNPTHGALNIAVNSVVATQHSHVAALDGHVVRTQGNAYAHVVLRGGNRLPNYALENLHEIKNYLEQQCVKNPAIIIDASHDNCLVAGKKDYRTQSAIIFEVLKSIAQQPAVRTLVKGFMLESFLQAGQQELDLQKPATAQLNGLSITDPCLGWEETADLLTQLATLPR